MLGPYSCLYQDFVNLFLRHKTWYSSYAPPSMRVDRNPVARRKFEITHHGSVALALLKNPTQAKTYILPACNKRILSHELLLVEVLVHFEGPVKTTSLVPPAQSSWIARLDSL